MSMDGLMMMKLITVANPRNFRPTRKLNKTTVNESARFAVPTETPTVLAKPSANTVKGSGPKPDKRYKLIEMPKMTPLRITKKIRLALFIHPPVKPTVERASVLYHRMKECERYCNTLENRVHNGRNKLTRGENSCWISSTA